MQNLFPERARILKRLFPSLLISAVFLLLAGCRTPLVNAILSDQAETVRILLDKGANVNEGSGDNFTPLHWAAYYGKTEMVKILLSRGAQVNARSTGYGTPLILAAQYGFTDTARALLEKGADTHLTDSRGRTALNYAEDGKFEQIVQLIKNSEGAVKITGAPIASLPERPLPAPFPGSAEPLPAIIKPGPTPLPARTDDSSKATAFRVTSPVKVSVFHFRPLDMASSGYGAMAADALTAALRTEPLFVMVDRKDLEIFLAINDLQQNERIENAMNIGTRMGINIVAAGTIEKRGSLIVATCSVISIDHRKIIFQKQLRSFGEINLVADMKKLGDAIIEALKKGSE